MFVNLKRCYVIAEIGGNFKTYEEAVNLIDGAKSAGVDCVKLQTYRADTIVSKKAMFDMESTGKIPQHEYFRKHEISDDLHKKIIDYIEKQELDWFSSPSYRTDIDMLLSLGMKAIKIGADDANNLPFLKYAARTKLPIVLSTGMCTLNEVREAVDTILKEGNENIVILHTVSGYPTYSDQVNLDILKTYKREFPDFYVGFSDHTLTPLAIITAAAMEADVVERHFTLDKGAEGPDHMISSTPDEMKYIVDSIREIEKMRGNGIKMPYGPEVQNRMNCRKSLVMINRVQKGCVIRIEDVDIKRPGHGIEPKYLEQVPGRTANRDLDPDDVLTWKDIS